MKLTLGQMVGVTLLSAACFSPYSRAAEKPNSTHESATALVDDEFRRAKIDFHKDLSAIRKRHSELQAHFNAALSQSEKQADVEAGWVENLKRYQTLITSRYLDEKGEYLSSKEVGARDLENINRLMTAYLRSSPLQGRVSAGQAYKTLDTGISQVKDLMKIHRSPSPSNNSELEILQTQIETAENSIKKLVEQGKKLGFDSTEEIASGPAPTNTEKD